MGPIIAHPARRSQPPDLIAQHQDRRQVRQCHQAVDDLRQGPDHPRFQEDAHQDPCPLTKPEELPIDPSKQKFRTPSGVKAPAQDGRQGKQHQTAAERRRHPLPEALLQSQSSQLRAGRGSVGDRDAGCQDHQGRQRADDHGIEEHQIGRAHV